jgi:epoxyqueuosine reductase
MQIDIESILREELVCQGISLVGGCTTDAIRYAYHPSLASAAQGLTHALSLGYRLSDAVIDSIVDHPTLLYKHHYQTANWILDQTAIRTVAFLQKHGYRALAIPASQVVDWEDMRGHLSHRLVAYHAGHGWIGRSGLVVHPLWGARIRFVTVLTDFPFTVGRPYEGGCGTCRRCEDLCPAGAIRDGTCDLERCRAKLREFSRLRGIGHHICGVCVRACPVGGEK